MRRWLGWTITAIVLALILAVGPLAVGHLTKAGYEDLLASLIKDLPDREIQHNSYQQGWFASSAAVEVLIPPDPTAQTPLRVPQRPIRIRLDSRIEQGPLAWLTSGFSPVLGRVHTRVEVQGLSVALPVLPVSIALHADGAGLMQLQVPPGETPATAEAMGLRHGLIDGELRLSSDRETLAGWMALAGVELLSPTGPIARLSELRFEAELPDPASGTARLDVAMVEVAGLAQGPDASKSPPHTSALPTLRVEALSATLSRELRDGLLHLRLALSAQQTATARQTYGRSALGLSADRLDTEALADLAEGVALLGSGQVAPPMQGLVTAGLMMSLVPRFVASSARIGVEPIRIETPDGPVSGRLDLRLDPGADAPTWLTSGVGDWLALLRIDGDLELPETIALDWLARGVEDETLSVSQPAAAREEARTLLAGWVRDGWVSVRDARVVSAVRLGDGLLTINGKTVPLH